MSIRSKFDGGLQLISAICIFLCLLGLLALAIWALSWVIGALAAAPTWAIVMFILLSMKNEKPSQVHTQAFDTTKPVQQYEQTLIPNSLEIERRIAISNLRNTIAQARNLSPDRLKELEDFRKYGPKQ